MQKQPLAMWSVALLVKSLKGKKRFNFFYLQLTAVLGRGDYGPLALLHVEEAAKKGQGATN